MADSSRTIRRRITITMENVQQYDSNWEARARGGDYLQILERLFTCEWVGLAIRESASGHKIHISVRNTSASVNTAQRFIHEALPEFPADQVIVDFRHGDSALAEHLVGGVGERVLRQVTEAQLVSMVVVAKRKGGAP